MTKCKCTNCECQKCNSDEVPYEGEWACDEECNSGSEMGDCCKED
jgi:hypothetical protein